MCVLIKTAMKYTVKFLIEARKEIKPFTPINIDVNYSAVRIRYYTGFRISTENWVYNNGWIPDNWDIDGHRVIAGCKAFEGKHEVSAIKVNRLLDKINGTLGELFDSKLPPSKEDVISFLNDKLNKTPKLKAAIGDTDAPIKKDLSFWAMYERYIKETKVSPARRKQIKVTMNHLKKFDLKLTFEAVTADKLRKFEKYLLTNKEKPKSKNTASGQLKKFRAFWNWAKKEITNLHYPFEGYSIDAELYGEPIFLTKAEVDLLYNAKLTDERLKRIRDIFIFQCNIGCRVGDLIELKTDNLVNGFIQYVPRKTKDDKEVTVSTPLTVRAKEMIERYNIPDGRLMPFISQQKYNDGLKDLFKDDKVKLNRIVIRLNPLTRIEEAVKLSAIVSSHMGRRTFVGNLFGKVDTSVITAMTGHVKDSKAFGRYYSVTDDLKIDALKNLE